MIAVFLGVMALSEANPATECDSLRDCTLVFGVVWLACAFLRVIDLILTLVKWRPRTVQCTMSFHQWLHYIEVTSCLVYMVLSTLIMIFETVECLELKKIVLFYLLVSYLTTAICGTMTY